MALPIEMDFSKLAKKESKFIDIPQPTVGTSMSSTASRRTKAIPKFVYNEGDFIPTKASSYRKYQN